MKTHHYFLFLFLLHLIHLFFMRLNPFTFSKPYIFESSFIFCPELVIFCSNIISFALTQILNWRAFFFSILKLGLFFHIELLHYRFNYFKKLSIISFGWSFRFKPNANLVKKVWSSFSLFPSKALSSISFK